MLQKKEDKGNFCPHHVCLCWNSLSIKMKKRNNQSGSEAIGMFSKLAPFWVWCFFFTSPQPATSPATSSHEIMSQWIEENNFDKNRMTPVRGSKWRRRKKMFKNKTKTKSYFTILFRVHHVQLSHTHLRRPSSSSKCFFSFLINYLYEWRFRLFTYLNPPLFPAKMSPPHAHQMFLFLV